TGETLAAVAACDTADVDRAVRGARAAFDAGVWSRTAPKHRKRVLQRLAELVAEHRDELALLETLDMGKPIRDSRGVDVPLAVEAGVPPGVLQVVPGFGETAGRAIGLHMDVDLVAFTGSTEVGKLFLRYSGESNMKRLALECGGKSPHIVLPDCGDLDAAAEAAAWGVFYNQGEVCNAGSRLLVHESLKDEFLERVVRVAETIR